LFILLTRAAKKDLKISADS